jgi:hypothetical protein
MGTIMHLPGNTLAEVTIQNYMDEWGLIVQKDGDGGDSAYRTALAATLFNMVGVPMGGLMLTHNLISQCYLGSGIWRRHPDTGEWYSDPDTFSRDQMAKVMLALMVGGFEIHAKQTLWTMAKRLFFHQNIQKNDSEEIQWKMPDIMSPGEWSNIIRGFDWWLLYPVLLILDLKFLADLHFRKQTPWDYDSLMAIDLAYANMVMPTWVSHYVAKCYRTTDWKERIMHNYADVNNGIEPLGKLYVHVCDKIFNKV